MSLLSACAVIYNDLLYTVCTECYIYLVKRDTVQMFIAVFVYTCLELRECPKRKWFPRPCENVFVQSASEVVKYWQLSKQLMSQ